MPAYVVLYKSYQLLALKPIGSFAGDRRFFVRRRISPPIEEPSIGSRLQEKMDASSKVFPQLRMQKSCCRMDEEEPAFFSPVFVTFSSIVFDDFKSTFWCFVSARFPLEVEDLLVCVL
jgi:hypothetical protein